MTFFRARNTHFRKSRETGNLATSVRRVLLTEMNKRQEKQELADDKPVIVPGVSGDERLLLGVHESSSKLAWKDRGNFCRETLDGKFPEACTTRLRLLLVTSAFS
ncbi:hypothetical protein PoB_000346500 [Plakobranchus ocellatus]|uniref:Uncharacterized protein n=1 Tax=Plakobranchus ocellatus TaxID=259542 RepID=A0AAV3Y2V0_9GAST|nr:hypothetical protein PoB_000346500 [Plakobranchus ocellatus]